MRFIFAFIAILAAMSPASAQDRIRDVANQYELKAAAVFEKPCGDLAPLANSLCLYEVLYFQSARPVEGPPGTPAMRVVVRCERGKFNGETRENCEWIR